MFVLEARANTARNGRKPNAADACAAERIASFFIASPLSGMPFCL